MIQRDTSTSFLFKVGKQIKNDILGFESGKKGSITKGQLFILVKQTFDCS